MREVSAMVAVDLDGDGRASEFIAASDSDYNLRAIKVALNDTTTSQPTLPVTTQPPKTTQPPITTQPSLPQILKAAANAGPDRIVAEGTAVTLTPNATPSSSGSKIIAYLWIENNVILNANISEHSLSKVFPVGTHNITLRVIDDASATASDTAVTTVNPASQPSNLSAVDSDGDGLTDEQERSALPGRGPGILKQVLIVLAVMGVIGVILLRGRIQNYFWERDWLK